MCLATPNPDNLADIRIRVDNNRNGSIDDSDPYVYNSDSSAGDCGYSGTAADIPSIWAYMDKVDYDQNPDGIDQFAVFHQYCLPDNDYRKPTARFISEGANWYYITVPAGYKVVGGGDHEKHEDSKT